MSDKERDTLYVWNSDGTAIFSKPSESSVFLDSLEPGTSMIIAKQLRVTNHKFNIKNKFSLNGFRVLVNSSIGLRF